MSESDTCARHIVFIFGVIWTDFHSLNDMSVRFTKALSSFSDDDEVTKFRNEIVIMSYSSPRQLLLTAGSTFSSS